MDSQLIFKSIFTDATIGIIAVNKQGKIVQANSYIEKLFGYSSGKLLNLPVEDLLPDALKELHIKHRKAYNKSPVPRSMGSALELSGQRKDGTQFPVEVSLSPLKIEDQLFVIAYLSDNTTYKIIREELERLNEDLELKVQERTIEIRQKEEKLERAYEKEKELGELKSRFVSMASHEFRTPLSSILSSANLISRYDQTLQQEKRMKHVNRIVSSVHNLTSILNDFLSLEKLESGKIRYHPVPIKCTEYVHHVIDEIQQIVKKNQEIIHHHSGENIIYGDEHLLRNILINLLSNAIKYSSEGKTVEILSFNQSNQLKIQIKDYGIGIPLVDQKNMFSRFFRATNVTAIQGTGLGLTIVKRYLDLMKGSISFTSKENEGTTFTVLIPQKIIG